MKLNIEELVLNYKNFLIQNKEQLEKGEIIIFGGCLEPQHYAVTLEEVIDTTSSVPITKKVALQIMETLEDVGLNLDDEIWHALENIEDENKPIAAHA